MKNVAQMSQWWETIREQFSPKLIFSILALPASLFLGVALGSFGPVLAAFGWLAVGVITTPLMMPCIRQQMALSTDNITGTAVSQSDKLETAQSAEEDALC